eukprot:2415141-Karenia_brevis.AAC.1
MVRGDSGKKQRLSRCLGRSFRTDVWVEMELALEMVTKIWVVTNSGCRRAVSLMGAEDRGDGGGEPKQGSPLGLG